LDVVEIDAASNRGIDEVRSLREKVNYAPGLARYKVYIIDEVHMLTEAASNALLKTLEEPPPHVIFILATTESHKVISTIMSRCQRFNFYRLSQEAMVGKLKLICQKEGVDIASESLRLIARSATGSLRDAENILQQLIAYYGNQIDFEQVQAALGVSGDSRIRELAQCILNKDVSTGLQVINRVNNDGIDLRQFNLGLIEYLRGLLLAKSQCAETLDVTIEDLAEMKSLVANATIDYLLKAVKLFAGIDFRADNYSTLPLELALVECTLSSVTRQEQTVITESSQSGESFELPQKPVESPQEAEFPMSVSDPETLSLNISQNFDYLRSRWKEFIYSLRGEGSSGNLDAFLRSACEPVALEDDTLVLGFYYPFHKEKIEDPKYRHLVESKLEEVFGKPYKIQCILVDHKRETLSQPRVQNPLIKAALEMGARIKEES
jgi:DNA polymerase-3 subunit gamma/tau